MCIGAGQVKEMPKSPPPQPRYVTYVSARTYSAGGKWKFHANLGHAKNAVSYHSRTGGEIYWWDGDEWVLLYTVEPGSTRMPWRDGA